MTSGASFARAQQLRPGVALSAAQVAALTTDIVWLVEQTVTLADGSTTKALVPQVYVMPRAGDLDGTGTLIAARDININLSNDLTNSGTIAGRRITSINAQNIHNLGGQITALKAAEDINNTGGAIRAQDALLMQAGRDVTARSTTQSASATTAGNTEPPRVCRGRLV